MYELLLYPTIFESCLQRNTKRSHFPMNSALMFQKKLAFRSLKYENMPEKHEKIKPFKEVNQPYDLAVKPNSDLGRALNYAQCVS